jgi:hypothetical protein
MSSAYDESDNASSKSTRVGLPPPSGTGEAAQGQLAPAETEPPMPVSSQAEEHDIPTRVVPEAELAAQVSTRVEEEEDDDAERLREDDDRTVISWAPVPAQAERSGLQSLSDDTTQLTADSQIMDAVPVAGAVALSRAPVFASSLTSSLTSWFASRSRSPAQVAGPALARLRDLAMRKIEITQWQIGLLVVGAALVGALVGRSGSPAPVQVFVPAAVPPPPQVVPLASATTVIQPPALGSPGAAEAAPRDEHARPARTGAKAKTRAKTKSTLARATK